ncbi:MAG: MBL fold metallo-hydrolase [Nitrospirae bacterium]|nr:MBL fold metallo-hydrolase [Nitrospirota bacterium]
MKLIVLGSGTCVPSLTRNAPGYYLEAEKSQILVDCGSGTLLQLEKAGKSYKHIDAVFITHRHPDHFADLMPLIQALIATPEFRREKDLFIIAPRGFIVYYEKAIASILGKPKDFTVTLIEIEDKLDFGPFHIFTEKTVHSSDSIAYRFEHKDQSVVFTGDADYDQGIVELSINAGLLIADCSFPDSEKTKGHLSSKECGLIAKKAGVKKLLLSHLYPSGISYDERLRECKAVFEGEVMLAEDLMEIEI